MAQNQNVPVENNTSFSEANFQATTAVTKLCLVYPNDAMMIDKAVRNIGRRAIRKINENEKIPSVCKLPDPFRWHCPSLGSRMPTWGRFD
jgi:hypothetical protein